MSVQVYEILLICAAFAVVSSQVIPPPWTCKSPLPPAPPATNVRRLRPQDVKVVMAVGDSISAGFGMHAPHAYNLSHFQDMLVEYRGDVFSIGGNTGSYTLPNYLKKYNPNILGASVGSSLPLDYVQWKNHAIQPFDPQITHLNGAQSGATVEDVPAQIDYIAQQLRTTYSKSVDLANDWKILTIFIGANNLCDACKNHTHSQPDFFEQQLRNVLDKVHSQIPRVFVNIMLLFNISQVWDVMMSSSYCELAVKYFTTSECGCLTDHSTPVQRTAMDIFGAEYNKRMYKIEADWTAKNLSDFAVVVQPCLEKLPIKQGGVEFLSALDCFHPSADADTAFSIGLWNNMLQSRDQKMHTLLFNITFECPGPETFLQ